MGSDPQYTKWPLLPLAQQVFSLTNPYADSSARQTAATAVMDAIREHKMAPLYRYLAHPVDGVLNAVDDAGAAATPASAAAPKKGGAAAPLTLHRKPSVVGGMLAKGGAGGTNAGPAGATATAAALAAAAQLLAWDETLYQTLKAANDAELAALQAEEDEATEQAGDTEIQAARGKRAEFWARVGDKERALAAYEAVFEKTGVLGAKIDVVLAIVRVGLFFGDRPLAKKQLERAAALVDAGGDWDRRNRLKAYEGLSLLTVRSYHLAAPLLLDSLSTFTSYELCTYSQLVVYAVLAGAVSLKRVDFKAKVVDAPEIKAILGDGEEKLLALTGAISAGPGADDDDDDEDDEDEGDDDDDDDDDDDNSSEESSDAGSKARRAAAKKQQKKQQQQQQAPAKKTAVVNLTTLGLAAVGGAGSSGGGGGDGAGGADAATETTVDFAPLAQLVASLYKGRYQAFFRALAQVEEAFLTQDRYLHEHKSWFIREMRLRAYQQLLQSYRVVGLDSMAREFGVTVDFLDRDLARFIAAGRIPCTIDRVAAGGRGIIETNRPDDKNKQYQDVVRQGDQLITKLQKYGQAVRLRGSERA